MAIFDRIVKLTKQLFPTGRVFRFPIGENIDLLIKGLAESETRLTEDALAIFDSILPDNDNFTEEDATDWERRLGLVQNPDANFEDRKLAILRKMNHPGTIIARQHYLYQEGQLRAAGFDVYVHENRFDDGMGGLETRTPFEVSGFAGNEVQHGEVQHGETQHGTGIQDKVVNYIDEATDKGFNVGNNLRSTYFIGGQVVGDFADVPIERKDEFRQLILKLKPAQTVAYLFCNYV